MTFIRIAGKCAGMADAISTIVSIMAFIVIVAGIYWLGMILFGTSDWKNAAADHVRRKSPDMIEIIGNRRVQESRKFL